jgi:ClpP class serine protease
MKHKDMLTKTHSTSRKWEKSMKKRIKKSQRQLDKKVAKDDQH